MNIARAATLKDNLAGIVSLGDDANELIVFLHYQRPDTKLGHLFKGIVDRVTWRNAVNIRAFSIKYRTNGICELHKKFPSVLGGGVMHATREAISVANYPRTLARRVRSPGSVHTTADSRLDRE
ncbi:hypothetical protein CCP3SC1_1520004 [Gammaproteobacteria bacterium]